MTIKELIAKLKEYNPNIQIHINNDAEIYDIEDTQFNETCVDILTKINEEPSCYD